MTPHPIWPVVVLALLQLGDAALCIKPVPLVADCYRAVHWPQDRWWMIPPIKLAAAVGLLAGIVIPFLGAVTCAALVLYFVVAISMHIRARDFGRNLFVNATGMLVICAAVGLYCFVW